MLIRQILPGSHRDLELVSCRPDATVADLGAALDPGARVGCLWIDGRRVEARTALRRAGLVAGSEVSLHPFPVERASRDHDDPELHVDAPLDLPWSGTTPRNRTGGASLPPVPPAVPLPEPEPAAPSVTPIGLVAMAVSIVGAAVLVAVLGSWTYAAFAVIGPLMVLANTADSRLRRRLVRRRYRRRLRRDLVRLEADLGDAAEVELLRREALYPGASAACRTASAEPARCWEVRSAGDGAGCVRVGFGTGRWDPPLEGDLGSAAEAVQQVVASYRILPGSALGLALEPGRPMAIVGPPDQARSLARSVVAQLAATLGPADLTIGAVVADSAAAPAAAWNWLAWLPHSIDVDGGRLLATAAPAADHLAQQLTNGRHGSPAAVPEGGPRVAGPPCRRTIVVIDDPVGLRSRRSAARTLLRAAADPDGDLAAVVVLEPDDAVPASCRPVLRVEPTGALSGAAEIIAGPAHADLLSVDDATELARRLARFDDPELDLDGRTLPAHVRLPALLDLDGGDPPALVERWQLGGRDPAVIAPIGVADDGPVVVDLVSDGPHALVVGTTGSGKSEALRTLVLSLAAGQSPDHLVFVLVDFKGGSAFDACADLPHTVGLVTDLDDQLAARALRCLEAELRHREERFRAAGADDLSAFRRLYDGRDPLPRLVVVVDEFAALAATLPSFVDALVDVAQRGRSLGVHLVLATQRPGGAVTPSIRANVSLKVALRVQTPDESRDVIGSPAAADLPRHAPGRAILGFGPGEQVTAQLACSSLPTADSSPAVVLRPLALPSAGAHDVPAGAAGSRADAVGSHGVARTDLERLVEGMAAAWRSLDRPAPRRPWPDPLPESVGWPPEDHLGSPDPGTGGLALGIADDPDQQRVVPYRWDVDAGPLLGVGLPGSGPRELASTVALAAARRWPVSSCHIHVLDATGADLVSLSGLPHVGAVVTAPQIERQRRLVQDLASELAARRAGRPGDVRRVLVVHGATALQARWEEAGHLDCWPLLMELAAEGGRHGMHLCFTSESASVPHRLVAACSQRIVFRLGDPADQAAFGLPARIVPTRTVGRGLTIGADGEPVVVQVATPLDGLGAAVARLSGPVADPAPPDRAPSWVGVLPERVALSDVTSRPGSVAASLDPSGGLVLPIGLADLGLVAATLDVPGAAHGLVSGPPRSGRTTSLAIIARSASLIEGLRVVVVSFDGHGAAGRDSCRWPEGLDVVGPDSDDLRRATNHEGPLLVLVDDADRTADDHPVLTRVATERRPDRHVIAAARNDRLRSRYGHWMRELAVDGIGLLLVPDPDLDGDLLGARLPRRPPVTMVPGRAWMTGAGGGAGGFVQVAHAM